MKKFIALLFKGIIGLIGISSVGFLIYMPQLEGRNVNATLFEIYFKDPFLACAYVASIAFFVGLYQVFKLCGYWEKGKLYTTNSLGALRILKFCALVILGFVLTGVGYLFLWVRGQDDIAGGVAMGVMIGFISIVVAIVANMFEKRLRIALSFLNSSNLS